MKSTFSADLDNGQFGLFVLEVGQEGTKPSLLDYKSTDKSEQ